MKIISSEETRASFFLQRMPPLQLAPRVFFCMLIKADSHRPLSYNMDPPEQQQRHRHHHQPNPWFMKLLSLQSDIISECLVSLTSPVFSLISLASDSFRRVQTKETVDSTTSSPPSTAVNGSGSSSSSLLKKAVLGMVGAAYACLILATVMVVAVVLGVGLVRFWVEEPVQLQENLYFDYTDAHPYAVLDFRFKEPHKLLKNVPVGHICNVQLVLVMPESDYNREIGMFQVVAEVFSKNGDVITRSSRPCMLRYQSLSLRLMRTFLMGVPLLLGITSEIQTVKVPILRYKEHYLPRTQSIKISLVPRAGTPFLPQIYEPGLVPRVGTPFLPQIYEARMVMSSELPWRKELIRRWKWTFYVWTTLYIYIMLLVVLVSCFRSIMFPGTRTVVGYQRVDVDDQTPQATDRPISETVRRWRLTRNKRKAMLLGRGLEEVTAGSSDATSVSVTRDKDTSVTTEEVGDSESICQ